MQADEYFMALDETRIKGQLQNLISQQQVSWRPVQRLQKEPLQRISKHIRSIDYNSKNTRTIPALKQSLNYLTSTIFPILLKQNQSSDDRIEAALFLQDRLKAISCQYFVQGIIHPKEALKLARANMVIEMVKENKDYMDRSFVGLQDLLSQENRQIMIHKFEKEYVQALKYSVLMSSIKCLKSLIHEHSYITDDNELSRLLRLRIKIERHNYESFFIALQQEEPIVQCILWRYNSQIRPIMLEILKKAFLQVPINWLNKRRGFKTEGEESFVSIKNRKEEETNLYMGYCLWIDQSNILEVLSH